MHRERAREKESETSFFSTCFEPISWIFRVESFRAYFFLVLCIRARLMLASSFSSALPSWVEPGMLEPKWLRRWLRIWYILFFSTAGPMQGWWRLQNSFFNHVLWKVNYIYAVEFSTFPFKPRLWKMNSIYAVDFSKFPFEPRLWEVNYIPAAEFSKLPFEPRLWKVNSRLWTAGLSKSRQV